MAEASTNGHHHEPPAPAGALVALLAGVGLAGASLFFRPGVSAAPPGPVLAAGGVVAVLAAALAFRLPANRSLAVAALFWLGLIAWGAASISGSLDRHLSQNALISWVGGLGVLLALGLGTPVARFWRAAAALLMLSATAVALLGLITTLPAMVEALQSSKELPRLAATFTNPDCLSAVLAVAALLAAGLAGSSQGPIVLPVYVCTGVLLGSIVLTGSRAGMLGVAVGYATFGLLLLLRGDEKGRRGAALGLGAPLLLGLLLVFTQVLTPALGRWGLLVSEEGQQGIQMRLAVARLAPAVTLDRPLLGSGPGTFHLAFQEHRPPGLRAYVNVAHNDYVQVAVETGVPGLLLFLAALGLPMYRAAACALRGPFPPEAAAAAGAAVAMAVYALLNFALPVPADLYWWCAALGLCLSDPLSSRRPRGASVFAVAPAALMLAVAGVGAILVGSRMTSAALLAQDAERLARTLRWEQAQVAASAALEREPLNPEHHLRIAGLEERQARLSGDPQQLKSALAHVQAAHDLSPPNVPVSLELARLRRENGDVDGAESLLLGMRQTAPNDLRVDAVLAEVYLRHGRIADAAECLWRSSTVSRDVAAKLAILIDVLEEMKKESGVALLRKWSQDRREDALQVVEEAITHMQRRGKDRERERMMALRVELDPQNLCATLQQAELALGRGDKEQGRELLAKALALEGVEGEANAACYRQALELWVAAGIQDKHFAELERILKEKVAAQPWEGWLSVLLCDVYTAQGDTEKASKVLQEGLDRRATDPSLLARLGQYYESQGVPETAIRYYKDALRADPGNSRIAEQLQRLEAAANP